MTDNFKFKFKITGLELEVEGSKEEVIAITSNFGNQLKSLAQPQGLNGILADTTDAEFVPENQIQIEQKRKKVRKPRTKRYYNDGISTALDFKTDPQKYGTPVSTWTTAQKAMWILFVVKNELSLGELLANQIVQTFNKHFKQAKIIRLANVSRDLGKVKLGSKALVGEDTTKSPSLWFLTDEGIKSIQALIKDQHSSNGTN